MFPIYVHPATRFVCRHCGGDAGHDPDLCPNCGPLCPECWAADEYPCQKKDTPAPAERVKTLADYLNE